MSLLCLINTFNKSYSYESSDKNNIIIDLPKISKILYIRGLIKNDIYSIEISFLISSLIFNIYITRYKTGIDVDKLKHK